MSSAGATSVDFPGEGVQLKDIQPNIIVSKLPFNKDKCPLFISEHGNATALYRYSNSGPFVELSNPSCENLIPALKHSIMQGVFCNFNFGIVQQPEQIVHMLEALKKTCARIHADLYDHLIRNTLMKQSFESLLTIIPFDPIYEMVPEIYRTNKATFRLLFFAQLDGSVSLTDPISSTFHCIRVKP